MVNARKIAYYRVNEAWVPGLLKLFNSLKKTGDHEWFHPHPLTYEAARKIASYEGLDLFYVQVTDGDVRGYGMLRGWDDGYVTPSLGIAIHPDARQQGLGRKFMHFLHSQARKRNAKRVRLKVYENNAIAKRFYESLGYTFTSKENKELVGFIEF
jgi:ribosomal protein S18 acetylase RimI-like enzyme